MSCRWFFRRSTKRRTSSRWCGPAPRISLRTCRTTKSSSSTTAAATAPARSSTALTAEFPRLRPQHHPQNRGYGAALRTGFDAATKRFVFYMDGDGQFDIGDLDLLLPLVTDDTHIVTGYRHRPARPVHPAIERQAVRRLAGAHPAERAGKRPQLRLQAHSEARPGRHHARVDRRPDQCRDVRPRRPLRLGIKEVGVHHYARTAGVQTGAHPLVIFRAFYDLVRLRQKIVSGS